ncbi:MAG: hypothetical protein V1743_03000 [Nanoarchaeota archaeon]
MNSTQQKMAGSRKRTERVLLLLMLLLSSFIMFSIHSSPASAAIVCTLDVEDTAIGFDETNTKSNVGFNMESCHTTDSAKMGCSITYDYGGDCEYTFGSTAPPYYETSCEIGLRVPTGLAIIGACTTEKATTGRDFCISAEVRDERGNSMSWNGFCQPGDMSSYKVTLEQPELDLSPYTPSLVYQGQEVEFIIQANSYQGLNPYDAIEIDVDCAQDIYGECDKTRFDPDITITSSELLMAGETLYEITDYMKQFTYTTAYDPGEYTTGIKTHDAEGERFAKGPRITLLSGPPLPSCESQGGYVCDGESGCLGTVITGTSSGSNCCSQPCTPLCAALNGNPCNPGITCIGSGAHFADSYDYGTGLNARCCVQGQCQEFATCAQYQSSKCCAAGTVCQGGGTSQPNTGGCIADQTCYSGCTSQQCVIPDQLCSNANSALGSCTLTNEGEKKCGNTDLLCSCENSQWKLAQACTNGCASIAKAGRKTPEQDSQDSSETILKQTEQIAIEDNTMEENSVNLINLILTGNNDYCSLPTVLQNCEDSDSGDNNLLIAGRCMSSANGNNPDSCTDTSTVVEYACDAKDKCVAMQQACPEGMTCHDGACVETVCAAEAECTGKTACQKGPNTAVPCRSKYSSGQLSLEKSSNQIGICDKEIMDAVKDWIYANNNLYSQIKSQPALYDAAVSKVTQEMKNLFDQSNKNCPFSCQDGTTARPPGNMLKFARSNPSGACGYCFEWSSIVFSLMRSLGIPESRVKMLDYQYDMNYPALVLFGGNHNVVVYQKDDGSYDIIDIAGSTSGEASQYPVSQWFAHDMYCSLCRNVYIDDFGISEWRDGTLFGNACGDDNQDWCGNYCPDGTPAGQCSQFKPAFCNAQGILDKIAPLGGDHIYGTSDDCGCPSGLPLELQDNPGSEEDYGYCSCEGSQADTCLGGYGNPLFCFNTGKKKLVNGVMVDVGVITLDCRKVDKFGIACGCPSATTCNLQTGNCEAFT